MKNKGQNVLGTELEPCGLDPVTGYHRDGCCVFNPTDPGKHTVCAVMTDEFLRFSKERGNDLSTPRPEFEFPGLKAGDRWCVCLLRWIEAAEAGKAPPVVLEATHIHTLEYVSLSELKAHRSGR